MGYGAPDDWDSIEYERQRRNLMQRRRFENKKAEAEEKEVRKNDTGLEKKILLTKDELSKQKKRIADGLIDFD